MGIPLVFLLFLCPHPHQCFLAGAGALVLRTGSVEAVDKREEELMGGKAVALLYLVVAHVGELVGAVALEAVSPTATRLVCGSCSSGLMFAASFFQIPSHGGHPCSWLCDSRY